MKRFAFLFAVLFALSLSSLRAWVAEPGHYVGHGGVFSFTLMENGEVHHLRLHDQALIARSGPLKHGRTFHFDHRVLFFHYYGDVNWKTETHCEMDFHARGPLPGSFAVHRIAMHRME